MEDLPMIFVDYLLGRPADSGRTDSHLVSHGQILRAVEGLRWFQGKGPEDGDK